MIPTLAPGSFFRLTPLSGRQARALVLSSVFFWHREMFQAHLAFPCPALGAAISPGSSHGLLTPDVWVFVQPPLGRGGEERSFS